MDQNGWISADAHKKRNTMKPAICSICGKFPATGDWVAFQDHDERQPIGLSHPPGLEYFCDEHVGAARRLVSLDAASALEALKKACLHHQ